MAKNKLIQPFVKWVGGKRQLLPSIQTLMPKQFGKYYEPFIGGGAVLFHLTPKLAVINDFNTELTNVYKTVRENLSELIEDLKKHENNADYFYQLRSLDRTKEFKNLSEVERASRIIYLNKTCFNGLYRVNNSGEFNAPFGKYSNPNIVNEPVLKAVSNFLNSNSIEICTGDYKEVLARVETNSFVYIDPPYYPVSASSNFTGYIQGGWTAMDQIELRSECDKLDAKGIKFLLSNSASDFIIEQYENYKITKVKAARLINSDADKRGHVDEVLIRNYE